ncbi:kinase-like domain-containing protein [Glomus cerebriforme]|uniref:Kinase-like domain-containing protein n=1 Tax=Glomus cerebriforme TaxID=658196 RepID=A0A397TQJ4_9GLOM|nr:kinase-like domain-containing protein [Glomus cerebriforme]
MFTIDHLKLIFSYNMNSNRTKYNKEFRTFEQKLCEECNQPETNLNWCQPCNSKRFQQDFNKWSSGNKEIDEFIQNIQLNATHCTELLEWIPYNRFKNIKYLAKGGFGTVYSAEWDDGIIIRWDNSQNKWIRRKDYYEKVALKCLNDSQHLHEDFFQEIINHKKVTTAPVVPCYGISQDPKTKNYIMIMRYMEAGDLKQFINRHDQNARGLINILSQINNTVHGLSQLHYEELLHKDLHSGNLLFNSTENIFISDLGLCKPVNDQTKSNHEKKIYGILPYVAPEVLRGNDYTKASDIYSFGILAYEMISGLPPYHDLPHNESLAIKICLGLRPKLNIKIPPCFSKLIELIDQCLDADPLNRPTADELYKFTDNLFGVYGQTEERKQINEANSYNKLMFLKSKMSSKIHPQAIYTSRPLDFKNLPEPQNSKEIYDLSDSLNVNFTNLDI